MSRDTNWNYGGADNLKNCSFFSLFESLHSRPFKRPRSESAPSLLPPLCWQVDLRLTEDERTAASSTKGREPLFPGWFLGSPRPAWVELWLQSGIKLLGATIESVLICGPSRSWSETMVRAPAGVCRQPSVTSRRRLMNRPVFLQRKLNGAGSRRTQLV